MRSQPGPERPTVLVAHPSPDLYGSDRVLLESVAGLDGSRLPRARGAASTGAARPGAGGGWRRRGVRGHPRPAEVRASPPRPRPARGVRRAQPPGGRAADPSERPDLVLVNTITIPLWLVARASGRADGDLPRPRGRAIPAPCLASAAVPPAPAGRSTHREQPVQPAACLPTAGPSWAAEAGWSTTVYRARRTPWRRGPSRAARWNCCSSAGSHHARVRRWHFARWSSWSGSSRGRYRLTFLGGVFPGYEWFEQELRAYVASHELSTQVVFLGFDPDIWGHLAASDVVLVPSTVDEPFGNTAVEAMLALRPLVVSDTSGLRRPRTATATARLVTPDDPRGDRGCSEDAGRGLAAGCRVGFR